MNDPFINMKAVPTFTVTSTEVTNHHFRSTKPLSKIFKMPGGQDQSPELSWSGAPLATKSYVVSMYDPDTPTMSGYWHWLVINLPNTCQHLASDSGNMLLAKLPSGAKHCLNDFGKHGYIGAAPPKGHGNHRYYLTIFALDIPTVSAASTATPGAVNVTFMNNIIGRASLIVNVEHN